MNGMTRSCVILIACLGLMGVPSWARGQDAPPAPKPTAEHERLAKDVGTWDATI
jgi:hypothetical protein